MFKKVYVEITNICNLSCSFCHKTEREGRMMSAEEFVIIADRLKGRAQQLYFHLMGWPLLNPELPGFIRLAAERGFQYIDIYQYYVKNGEMNSALSRDGVHLKNKAYQYWRNAIRRYVTK